MQNKEIYNNIFMTILDVPLDLLNDELTVLTAEHWDSVAQFGMVIELEDKFDILLDAEDIVEFVSYKAGKEILAKYHIIVED